MFPYTWMFEELHIGTLGQRDIKVINKKQSLTLIGRLLLVGISSVVLSLSLALSHSFSYSYSHTQRPQTSESIGRIRETSKKIL